MTEAVEGNRCGAVTCTSRRETSTDPRARRRKGGGPARRRPTAAPCAAGRRPAVPLPSRGVRPPVWRGADRHGQDGLWLPGRAVRRRPADGPGRGESTVWGMPGAVVGAGLPARRCRSTSRYLVQAVVADARADVQLRRRPGPPATSITLAERQIPWVEARLTPLARRLGEDSVDAMVTRLRDVRRGRAARPRRGVGDGHRDLVLPRPGVFDELGHPAAAASVGRTARATRTGLVGRVRQRPGAVQHRDGRPGLRRRTPGAQVGVLATDWSDAMVARTRAATYSHLEVNRGLPARRLVQAMHRDGAGWRVRPELAALVTARRHNLVTDPVPVGRRRRGAAAQRPHLLRPRGTAAVLARVVAALAPAASWSSAGPSGRLTAPAGLVRGRGGRAPWYRLDGARGDTVTGAAVVAA